MTSLAASTAVEILLYVGVIAAAAVVLGLLWLWMRKRFQQDTGDASLGMGFTLDELARLHDRGDLTDEQYQRARTRIAQAGRSTVVSDHDQHAAPSPASAAPANDSAPAAQDVPPEPKQSDNQAQDRSE